MSVDWATIKPSISSQIATLSGLASKLVRWVDEPSGDLAGALPVIWLRVDPVVNVGVDFETRSDNGVDEQTVTVIGQRDFTLHIRIESFTPDIADQRHAANIGENIKTRLKRSTSVQGRAGVWAIRQLLMTRKIEYIEANRTISTYLLDILCATVNLDIDTTTGAGDWIGEVQGSGTVKQQDGTIIDTPTFDAKAD